MIEEGVPKMNDPNRSTPCSGKASLMIATLVVLSIGLASASYLVMRDNPSDLLGDPDIVEQARQIAVADPVTASGGTGKTPADTKEISAGDPSRVPWTSVDPEMPIEDDTFAGVIARIRAAIEARNGNDALAELKRLLAMGEEGYEAAIALILEMNWEIGRKELGLEKKAIREAILDEGFLRYVLANWETDARLRELAMGRIHKVLESGEALSIMVDGLWSEQDPEMINSILDTIADDMPESWMRTQALVDGYQSAEGIESMRKVLSVFQEQTDEESRVFLEEVVRSGPPGLAQQASVALIYRTPPVSGYVTLRVSNDSQAWLIGLRPGDVIVSYDGIPIDSDGALETARQQADGRKVSIKVFRNGTTLWMELQGGRAIGVRGGFRSAQ